MAKHRTHSIEFKRQVVQEFLGGESPPALAKRHGISRNLIKIGVAKYEAGGLDSDAAAADVLADYEARIAALERLVGKLALENEFLRGASRPVRQPRSASTSVVAGPLVSQSQKDAGGWGWRAHHTTTSRGASPSARPGSSNRPKPSAPSGQLVATGV